MLAEKYSILDIMTLLFHNTDTTLDALTSVIKACFIHAFLILHILISCFLHSPFRFTFEF